MIMKIKLSPKDVLQLSKMVRSGCIDTDKVDGLRKLAQGYTPPQKTEHGDYELYMYRKVIGLGLGLLPVPFKEWWNGLSDEIMARLRTKDDGKVFYNNCLEDIFDGVVAMFAIGMKHTKSGVPNSSEACKAFQEFMNSASNPIHYIIRDEYFDNY